MKPLIFVSCGQYSDEEIALGKALVKLITDDGRFEAYFAENQSSLEGVTQNILAKLEAAAGFVAVLHPRGEVRILDASSSTPSRLITRASVWIEQEIAVLAMLAQVHRRPIRVQIYSKRGVAREGLRIFVMTNPVEFETSEEVLRHFANVLKGWSLQVRRHGVALVPVISRTRDGQDPTFHTLHIAYRNIGDEKPGDARVRSRFPMKFIRHVHVSYETRRTTTHLEFDLGNEWFRGQNLFQDLYPGDTTRVVQDIWYYVDDTRNPAAEDAFEIEIRSGNAPAYHGKIRITDLQALPEGERYVPYPSDEGFASLIPEA